LSVLTLDPKALKNSFQLSVITSADNNILHFFTVTDDQRVQWVNILNRAFKDITEEHRSIVRNANANYNTMRHSSLGDAFKRGAKTGGLSSTLLRKVENLFNFSKDKLAEALCTTSHNLVRNQSL
jgi:hypothetical protein